MRRVRKPVRRPGRSRAALDNRRPTEDPRQRPFRRAPNVRAQKHHPRHRAVAHRRRRLAVFHRLSADGEAAPRRTAQTAGAERAQPHAAQPSNAPQPVPAPQAGAPQPGAPQPGAPPLPNAPAASGTQARESVIAATPHVAIDTPRLKGSIDLKGARLDDLALEQYRETIDPHSPAIVLFSPSGAPEAYYAEFGWVAASGTSQKLPGPDTVWTQEGPARLPSVIR